MSARLVSAALSLAVLASVGHAQQIPAARLARTTASAPLGAPAIVPSDSVVRYVRAAHAQRWTGGSLVALGFATMAGAYARFIHSGRMGMNGGQVATLAIGAGVGAMGGMRLRTAHESMATAARWSEADRVGETAAGR